MSPTLLPLPDDPRYQGMIDAWPDPIRWPFRSRWLAQFEFMLRETYPTATKRDRNLTARHYAPFYLRDGPDVP